MSEKEELIAEFGLSPDSSHRDIIAAMTDYALVMRTLGEPSLHVPQVPAGKNFTDMVATVMASENVSCEGASKVSRERPDLYLQHCAEVTCN